MRLKPTVAHNAWPRLPRQQRSRLSLSEWITDRSDFYRLKTLFTSSPGKIY